VSTTACATCVAAGGDTGGRVALGATAVACGVVAAAVADGGLVVALPGTVAAIVAVAAGAVFVACADLVGSGVTVADDCPLHAASTYAAGNASHARRTPRRVRRREHEDCIGNSKLWAAQSRRDFVARERP
jgi:hypothetical protein